MTVINGLPAHALLHFLVVLAPLAWCSGQTRCVMSTSSQCWARYSATSRR